MSDKPIVKNLLIINVAGENIKIPTQQIRFEMTGINTSIANAIRRVAYGELQIKRLYCDPTDIISNDRYLISLWVSKMLSNIVIDQKILISETFKLHAENKTSEPSIVTTSSIISNNKYWQPNAPLCSLKSYETHRLLSMNENYIYITIKNIRVKTSLGIDDGKFNQCSHASIQPIDAPPKTFGGTSSTESFPTHYYFKLLSNGGYDPNKLLNDICENIIERLRNIEEESNKLKNTEPDIYEFLTKENHTIVNMVYYELVTEIIPDTEFVTFKKEQRFMSMRAREQNLNVHVGAAVKSLIAKFGIIKSAFADAKTPAIDCLSVTEIIKTASEKFKHLPLIDNTLTTIKGKENEKGFKYIHV